MTPIADLKARTRAILATSDLAALAHDCEPGPDPFGNRDTCYTRRRFRILCHASRVRGHIKTSNTYDAPALDFLAWQYAYCIAFRRLRLGRSA